MPVNKGADARRKRLERTHPPSEFALRVMSLAISGLSEQEIVFSLQAHPETIRDILGELAGLLAPQPKAQLDAMGVALSFDSLQYFRPEAL